MRVEHGGTELMRRVHRDVPKSAVVMLVVAVALATSGRERGAALLVILAVVRATLAAWPRIDRAIDHTVGSIAGAAGTALGHAVLWVLAVVVIAPAGAVSRRVHPDGLRRFAGDGWQVPQHEEGASDRPYNTVEARAELHRNRPDGLAGRWLRLGAATIAMLALISLLEIVSTGDADASRPARAPALAHQSQVDTMQSEEGAVFARLRPDPALGWRLPAQAKGTTVSITNGHRRSTGSTPGAPVVWFFGGSAMWGSGQRDAHTLPSEFARLAARNGTPVQVVNWGVFGYTSVQEVAAFERSLAANEAPDVVVFYDGYNDVAVGAGIVLEGLPSGSQAMAPLPVLRRGRVVTRGPGDPVRPMTDAATSRSVVTAYDAAMADARRAADAHGVAMVQLWQPNAFTTSSPTADATGLARLGYSPFVRRELARLHRSAAAALPPEVIDLSGALRAAPDTFVDQVHTNERGASVVAAAMYRSLRPQLAEAER